jgi:hypothetical protein
MKNKPSEDDEEVYIFEQSPLSSNGEDNKRRRGESTWKKNQGQTRVPRAAEEKLQSRMASPSLPRYIFLSRFWHFSESVYFVFMPSSNATGRFLDVAYCVVITLTTVGQDDSATPSTSKAASIVFTICTLCWASSG